MGLLRLPGSFAVTTLAVTACTTPAACNRTGFVTLVATTSVAAGAIARAVALRALVIVRPSHGWAPFAVL